MTMLSRVVTQRSPKPAKMLLYGMEGIGKSYLAAKAEAPLFADVENGIRHIKVPAVSVENSREMMQLCREMTKQSQYKTFVMDSIDAFEKMLVQDVCDSAGKRNIEDFGFGKGYVYLEKRVREFITELEEIVLSGCQVILIGHADIASFTDPGEASYSRYQMRLHKKTANALLEWCDACLFMTRDVIKDTKASIVREEGRRIIKTENSNSVQAKNRYNMPKEIAASWTDIKRYIPHIDSIRPVREADAEKHRPSESDSKQQYRFESVSPAEFEAWLESQYFHPPDVLDFLVWRSYQARGTDSKLTEYSTLADAPQKAIDWVVGNIGVFRKQLGKFVQDRDLQVESETPEEEQEPATPKGKPPPPPSGIAPEEFPDWIAKQNIDPFGAKRFLISVSQGHMTEDSRLADTPQSLIDRAVSDVDYFRQKIYEFVSRHQAAEEGDMTFGNTDSEVDA